MTSDTSNGIFSFTVPDNVVPGDIINVVLSDGRKVQIALPEDSFPGQTLHFDLSRWLEEIPEGKPPFADIIIPKVIRPDRKIAVEVPSSGVFILRVPSNIESGQRVQLDLRTKEIVHVYDDDRDIEIEVPDELEPDTVLLVTTPFGYEIEVVVPETAEPGDKLLLDSATGKVIQHTRPPGSASVTNQTRSPTPVTPPSQTRPSRPVTPPNQTRSPRQKPKETLIRYESISEEDLPEYPSWLNFALKPTEPFPLETYPVEKSLPPVSTGRKKALLIGINYIDTEVALNGCINDVIMMRDLLTSRGFTNSPETMVCLVDNSIDPIYLPTRINIIKGLQWLGEGATSGDTLFFHFSGHGAQQQDNSGREPDGMNETLCPLDFNKPDEDGGMISDDELWDILCAPLPSGCRLYALFDCCHSGTGLDLSYSYVNNRWFTVPNPNYGRGDVIMFSGCRDNQTTADAWSHDMNAHAGAMTTSFINCCRRSPKVPISVFFSCLSQDIRNRGFTQVPQLSSSQIWKPNERVLDFDNGLVENKNPVWGKIQDQNFDPQRPNMSGSPLGSLLIGAGFDIIVENIVTSVVEEATGLIEEIAEQPPPSILDSIKSWLF